MDCKPGFEKKQDGNLSCKADGNWNKRFPQCNGMKQGQSILCELRVRIGDMLQSGKK